MYSILGGRQAATSGQLLHNTTPRYGAPKNRRETDKGGPTKEFARELFREKGHRLPISCPFASLAHEGKPEKCVFGGVSPASS